MNRRIVIAATLLLTMANLCQAQDAATQPATRAVPTSQERLNDLITLIEGQNPPEVRRAIARELLLQRWPETTTRLILTLNSPNGPARIAVALALAELPQFLDPAYIDALMQMLADADADVRAAGAKALAGYRDNGVIPRLRRDALDAGQPQRIRLGAIAALGMITQRESVDGLAEVLGDPDPAVSGAALVALQQATAMDFGDDIATARAWWEGTKSLSREEWQQLQIERLVQKDRDTRARLDLIEARLVKLLEANFLRAPDAERVTLLGSYLADPTTTIRQLGLKLVRTHLQEGKSVESLSPEIVARVRELMTSSEPREQAAAVRTVASFRDPRDADQFVTMLSAARNRSVRLALINGLGYVGNGPAVQVLLAALPGSDEETATEIVAALGKMAERGVLVDEARGTVVVALREVFDRTKPGQVALRERVLWAMGNVADPGFGPAFAAALDSSEAVAVRQVAVRGIAVLNDPKLADALVPACGDSDATVRKTAVETLGTLGSSDKHLQALWSRLTSPPETEEAIRQAAWRGAMKILEQRPAADIEAWLARVPGDGRSRAQRSADLLQRLLRPTDDQKPRDRGPLGMFHARLAAQYLQLDQPAEAIAEYVRALADLSGTNAEAEQKVAAELLRSACVTGRYDRTVAEALARCNPPIPPATAWHTIRSEIEPLLNPEGLDKARNLLDAAESTPPGAPWPQSVVAEIAELRQRIRTVEAGMVGGEPQSRPSSTPASTPTPATQPR